jgi:glycosyltransferase involved in cell wall biosynthesis
MTVPDRLIVNLSILFSRPTGIGNYATNLFPYLKSLTPTLLTSKKYPDFNCYSVPNNLTPADGTKGHLRRLVWTQIQLPRIYKTLKSQLLFSPIPEAPLSNKCRFIVTSLDLIPLRFPNRRSLLSAYHRYYTPEVFKQAQHIICISESTAKDITKFYGIPSNKITPILLAHDSAHFRPVIEEESQSRSKYPYFLYIGRHDPYKNISRLISAFANLPSKHEYQLWLAGPSDDRYTPALKTQIQELGIAHQVKFLNYVPYDELPKIISRAISLVFPSLWEGFGLPVLEAMACGTPVITSNLASMPEVAGDAAILVDPYDVNQLTDAMKMVGEDFQLRSKLRQAGLARAQQFSWEKTGKATATVLERYL